MSLSLFWLKNQSVDKYSIKYIVNLSSKYFNGSLQTSLKLGPY